MTSTDEGVIALAERAIGILDEGSFSSTYKFALFIAILDLCIERTAAHGEPPETLTTRQLASKVVELCWEHVVPYGSRGTLRFGGGRDEQAEIITRIAQVRAHWPDAQTGTWGRTRQMHEDEFLKLEAFVEWKLIEMPIPRLQVLGGQEVQFLYTYNWDKSIKRSVVAAYQTRDSRVLDNQLYLLPGVAENLVRLNGLLRPLFYREWAVWVARINKLPEADLERFLFGGDRQQLGDVRAPLRRLQGGLCFYCREPLAGSADVDHFIPWSRFPDNGLDNLVVAHPKCNNNKRDFLAAAEHVEQWADRRRTKSDDLATIAHDVGCHRDSDRSTGVAAAIYLRLPATARLWRRPGEFVVAERVRIAHALAS